MTNHKAIYLLETRAKVESKIIYEDDAEVLPEKHLVLELWNDEIEAFNKALMYLKTIEGKKKMKRRKKL